MCLVIHEEKKKKKRRSTVSISSASSSSSSDDSSHHHRRHHHDRNSHISVHEHRPHGPDGPFTHTHEGEETGYYAVGGTTIAKRTRRKDIRIKKRERSVSPGPRPVIIDERSSYPRITEGRRSYPRITDEVTFVEQDRITYSPRGSRHSMHSGHSDTISRVPRYVLRTN